MEDATASAELSDSAEPASVAVELPERELLEEELLVEEISIDGMCGVY